MNYSPDPVLPGFDSLTLTFPDDYDGPVAATLVRRRTTMPSRKAVLYLHGFNDYFFQVHLAEQYLARGFNFYALDLRKHGRSLRPFQHPNFCQDITEYYPDISAAIETILKTEAPTFLLLNGHSTGALAAVLYACEGRYRERLSALFLNSPFFGFFVTPPERLMIELLVRLGKYWPFGAIRRAFPPYYSYSIHHEYYGEWDYNIHWKPIEGFPLYFGWFRAISQAHQKVRQGVDLFCPVLVMHSATSIRKQRKWSDEFLTNDSVLNVEDMLHYGQRLGKQSTVVSIKGGLHDLVLSRAQVRKQVFARLSDWLEVVTDR